MTAMRTTDTDAQHERTQVSITDTVRRVRYFRRSWDETRGDEHDSWGRSTWHFETDADGVVTRQVEVYENGPMLRYGPDHDRDDFGGLTDQPLDLDEFASFEVSWASFIQAWNGR